MPKKPAIPPFRGASNNASFFDTGQPFAPADSLLNVIPFDATKDRPRIGVRPGSEAYFTGTFGNGRRIQGCGVVSRGKTASGYALGTGTDLPPTDGAGRTAGAIAGNVWKVDQTWGLTAYAYENVTATGPYSDTGVNTQPNRSVNAVAVSPDGTKILIGESYADASAARVARVTCLNASTLALIWSKKMTDTGINRFVNAIAVNSEWVFVCTNHFVRIFKLSDGSNPSVGASTGTLGGWSSEAIDCCLTSDGNSLLVLFYGTGTAAVLPSGVTVTTGITARHFRSGVMKYTIATQAQLTAGTATKVLTQTALSPQLANTARYYEGTASPAYTPHNYCRFSEQLPWAPRGLLPTAIALLKNGGFVVAHANAGWGPDGNSAHTIAGGFGHDDYAAPNGNAGYSNLSAFDSNGVFAWKFDADSIKYEPDAGGFLNDLGNPTALDVCVDTDGNVTVGGRRTLPLGNADGLCVLQVDQYGDFRWLTDLGGTVRTICAMRGSQNVVAGGDRNTDWPDSPSGTTEAHCWELRLTDGAFVRYLDLGDVSTLGLQPMADDALAQVTDKV